MQVVNSVTHLVHSSLICELNRLTALHEPLSKPFMYSGGELFDRIKAQPKKRFTEVMARDYMIQIVQSVAYVHEMVSRKVIHLLMDTGVV